MKPMKRLRKAVKKVARNKTVKREVKRAKRNIKYIRPQGQHMKPALVCPFGYELEKIPDQRCSPSSKKDLYVFCNICKDLQLKHQNVRMEELPRIFRRSAEDPGPDSSLT